MELRSPSNRPKWEILLPALVLVTPLVSFLTHHDYSLVRPEAALSLAIWAGLGCIAGVALHRSPTTLRVLILTACFVLFVDIQFDGAHAIGARRLALLAIGIALLVWVLRTHITRISTVGFAVLIVSIVILPDRIPALRVSGEELLRPLPSEHPPIIVLFLDEHVGVAGIPMDVSGGREARERILDLYARYAFRVHGGAYGQYFDTYNAIPNLLNVTASQEDNAYFDHGGEPRDLLQSTFLADMAAEGYAIRIYQSDYMNLCDTEGATPEFCFTYRRNSAGSIKDLNLPLGQKMRFIANSYLYRSVTVFRLKQLNNVAARLGLPLPELEEGVRRVGPIPVGAALDRLQSDVLEAPDGRLFLAHLMMPHFPYVYDASCRIKQDVSSWVGRNNDLLAPHAPGGNTDESRRSRYEAYLVQLQCLQDRLESFFESLQKQGILDRATLIVQGDHGSRINRINPETERRDDLEPMDYADGFAAFFAARTPRLEPGYDEDPITLVRAFARALDLEESKIETDFLLLRSRESTRLTPVPMPPF